MTVTFDQEAAPRSVGAVRATSAVIFNPMMTSLLKQEPLLGFGRQLGGLLVASGTKKPG